MSYNPIGFRNDTTPDINAENLNKMDNEIKRVSDAVDVSEPTDDMLCNELYEQGYETKVNNYVINESGAVVSNNNGYYLENINVRPGDICKIVITTSSTSLSNTRIHGYSGSTWEQQIALVANTQSKREVTFEIPNDVDNIKISTSKINTITIYSGYYSRLNGIEENHDKINYISEELYRINYERVNNYVIGADGTITANNDGYYLNKIKVTENKNVYLQIVTTISGETLIRVHGYSGDTWVEQIDVINISNKREKEVLISIPSGVDNIKISTSKVNSIIVYNNDNTYIDELKNNNDKLNILTFLDDAWNKQFNYLEEKEKVLGYIIAADGTVTPNANGYYIQDINVSPEDTYYVVVTSTTNIASNTRIHGYSGNTWVKQISVLEKKNGNYKISQIISINGEIDNIKISTTKTETVYLINSAYIDLESIDESLDEVTLTNIPDAAWNRQFNYLDKAEKISGYVIAADGTVTENRYGYYLQGIEVSPLDKYYLIVTSTTTNQTNNRVHGYSGDTWVEQIDVVVKLGNYKKTQLIEIPAGVDNIKISTTKSETLYLINSAYIDESRPGEIIVNMGNPYTYLSAEITDEILDSTTVDDVYAIYDALVTDYPKFAKRMPDIGYDESGLPIRLYRFGWLDPWMVGTGHESSWNPSHNIYTSQYDYQKLFVNAGTHGNEKSSVYGVALSIKEIIESSEPWALYTRGNFMIDVCPVANPWGYNNTSRNGYHVDGKEDNINRDFLNRTRSESQALYNHVISEDYYAYIDSHNSGGNANYFGITDTNPLLKTYVQMNMKLAGIVYNSWKQLAQGDQYAVDPYIQCWVSAPLGMFQDMMNELGIPGYLIESVGVFKSGIGTLTPNHKKYCKFTKDLLINSLIAVGTTKWN